MNNIALYEHNEKTFQDVIRFTEPEYVVSLCQLPHPYVIAYLQCRSYASIWMGLAVNP